jgi:hydrogenase maturation protease
VTTVAALPPLLLGVGNVHRHDDGVGPEAAARSAARLGDRVRTRAIDGDGSVLLDLWNGEAFVIVVDAVGAAGQPGRIHRRDGGLAAHSPPPAPTSTHALSVGEAADLGRTLGMLPARLVVFGVEGVDFSPGTGLTPAVDRGVDRVVDAIAAELDASAARSRPDA